MRARVLYLCLAGTDGMEASILLGSEGPPGLKSINMHQETARLL